MRTEIRCPNCGTAMMIGKSGNAVTELSEGIHYLVPETIRNENVSKGSSVDDRIKALKAAGINVDKLQNFMNSNEDFKSIFESDDPILDSIAKGGFIKNPELFRRWITAQTFRLLSDKYGWTHAARKHYNTRYVIRMTKNELAVLCNLERKGLKGKDRRFEFFTLDDLRVIFNDLNKYNRWVYAKEQSIYERISNTTTYSELYNVVSSITWSFYSNQTYIPVRWLNCFKGAGAFYTLQNIINTHDFVLPNCKDTDESLKRVDKVFNNIIEYKPNSRRWDILLSVLTVGVKEKKFELKY